MKTHQFTVSYPWSSLEEYFPAIYALMQPKDADADDGSQTFGSFEITEEEKFGDGAAICEELKRLGATFPCKFTITDDSDNEISHITVTM